MYDFGGKRIDLAGMITLLIFFDTLENPITEYITFDVVDTHYPYNAIFGREMLNTFKAALHSGYLCLKVPATFGIIPVFGSQKDVRNIEQGITLGHKNVHFIREESEQYQQSIYPIDTRSSHDSKKVIKADGGIKKVALDLRVPDKVVCLGTKITLREQVELLAFLNKNNNLSAWSTSGLTGVSRDVIEHRLEVNKIVKARKQKLRKMS
jgi:hypothetical protein